MKSNDLAWLSLSGKTCTVTGAAGGIGRQIALAFASAGANVAALDFNLRGAEETVEMLLAAGGAGISVQCDVTDEASVSLASERVQRELGACEVLVNNAGAISYGRLESVSVADWERLMRINLTGYLLCSQQFGRGMLDRGKGSIVHVASIAATEPHPFCGAYSSSKAAIAMLSNQMALEWGPRGVRVNAISPGFVRTPLSDAFYQQPGVTEQRNGLVPMRRIGVPEDVANAVLFVASDRAGYVSGANLVVDGGLSQASMSHVPRPGYTDAPV